MSEWHNVCWVADCTCCGVAPGPAPPHRRRTSGGAYRRAMRRHEANAFNVEARARSLAREAAAQRPRPGVFLNADGKQVHGMSAKVGLLGLLAGTLAV